MNPLIENKLRTINESNHMFFLNKKNVIGVGIGEKVTNNINTGEPSLHVLVTKKCAAKDLDSSNVIPKTYLGVKTDVIEIGGLNPLNSLVTRVRPLKLGYSISPTYVPYSGTAGCLVYDKYGKYILSNNHVLADVNSKEIGRAIMQPGGDDFGNSFNDVIAVLDRFVVLNFCNNVNDGIYNYVDCALAKLLPNIYHAAYVEFIGYPTGVAEPKLGDFVHKSGRTTGYTQGTITSINTIVSIPYRDGLAVFKNAFTTTVMGAGGDSGSLLLNRENKAVGLLFAGGPYGTIFTPISTVLDTLNVKLVTS
ncbi:trypsin-like peptidase domain-containing protein [Clostridium tarantellae]|uniref:Serine protease n=1 Tax=Clostridium tarantellae TaxID=39493 RepID=A0A6I1MM72_9CLOT|nr:trypsin-like peptidase domain-containing protein [Clostridium tarantellae]MPQ44475.1 serine protease [Clostridium tarantellae]